MRIWDIPCKKLCDKHLLGEHRELHAIWVYLTTSRGASYKKHPETLRWENNTNGLIKRHREQVKEFKSRGWQHASPLPFKSFRTKITSSKKRCINSIPEQIKILKSKSCKCKI